MQQTPFTSPGFDYSADLSAIERRKKLAEALQAQSFQPIEQAPVGQGQFATPISPWQSAAKLAQAFVGARNATKAEQQQRELSKKAQSDYQTMVNTGMRQLYGTPEKTIQPDPQENQQAADQGTPEVSAKTIPAQAPNPAAALGTFGAHPGGAQFVPLATQEMTRERLLAQSLGGAQSAPAAAGGTVSPPAYGSQGFDPNAKPVPAPNVGGGGGPRIGGPAGGQPMAAWLQGDPNGGYQKYMEQLAKDWQETQKPVINRGFGMGRMVNGQYVPDQASLDQALTMKRGEQAITGPQAAPINLKTSEGREIQLSPPEWADFQKTGQLPARLGGQPQPQPQAPQGGLPPAGAPPAQAPGTVRAAGLNIGIPGLGQTQEAVIGQHAEQAYRTERAKGYVKLAEDMRGGWQNAQTQRGMLDRLENLFQDPNIVKGATAESVSGLKNIAASAGIDIKGLSSEQAIQSITNEFAMQLRNPAGGAGMPGAMSDSDRKFLASIPPSLSKSPEGRKFIMETMRKKLERDQQIADMAIEYEHKHGQLNAGFEKEMREFSRKNPVFGKQPVGSPTLSPATLQFLKQNNIAVPGG